jgi:hypothetical protein
MKNEVAHTYFIAAVVDGGEFHIYLHHPNGTFTMLGAFLDARFVELGITCDLITGALRQAGLPVASYQDRSTLEFPELAVLFDSDAGESEVEGSEQAVLGRVFLS